jgi:hypothetical protein
MISSVAAAREGNSGAVKWSGPLGLLIARPAFLLAAQALAALALALQNDPTPFRSSAKYWTVWASLADLATLLLLAGLTRREGLRVGDLMIFTRKGLGRDIFRGLSLFPLFMALNIGGLILGDLLLYGNWLPVAVPAGLAGRVLPLWAVVFSRLVWWPLWSWMEETTFNGYALPRLERLTGKSWAAVALVTFSWSVQHMFLPTILDGRFLLWRFLVFIPVNLASSLIYLRLRRLTPIVLAHWGTDLLSTLFTIA